MLFAQLWFRVVWPMPGQTPDLNRFPALGASAESSHLLPFRLLLLNAAGELAKWTNGFFFSLRCLILGI